MPGWTKTSSPSRGDAAISTEASRSRLSKSGRVGTIDALRAIQTDPQMVNRFEPVALPRWEMNRDFQMLLASFERILPLRQPSLLAEPALATKLLTLSEGTIGELFALLVAATVRAIRSGAERIDEGVLGSIDWIAPFRTSARD